MSSVLIRFAIATALRYLTPLEIKVSVTLLNTQLVTGRATRDSRSVMTRSFST